MKNFIKIFILFLFVGAIINTYAFQIKDEIYAIVGNRIILKSSIQKRATLENITFDNALNQLIEENLLLYETKKENITASSKEVNQKLNKIKEQFPSSSDFIKLLNKNGFSDIKQFKQYLREQIEIEKLIQQNVVNKIQISPVEIAQRMKSISSGELLQLKTISFTNKPDEENFIKDFNAHHSEEIKKMQDIGWINIGELNPKIAKLIAQTSKGKLSKPLKNSTNKWTVFYVEDIQENNLKNIYIQAREAIFKDRYTKKLDQYIRSLKKQIPITISPNLNSG